MSILAFIAGLVAMYMCTGFSIYRSGKHFGCYIPAKLCIIWPYALFLPQYGDDCEEDDNG